MIGLFGIFNFDRGAPADLSVMADALPEHVTIERQVENGFAVGNASHRNTFSYRATNVDSGLTAHVNGWMANCSAFQVPNTPNANPADVLLHLAQTDGWSRLEDVNGQFCAVIHDRINHTLRLITDRNGTFPLYIWQDGQGVAFATQLYALAKLPRIPKTMDTEALAELFTMQRTIGDNTPISGVKALPAATLVTIGGGNCRSSKYWHLEWTRPNFSKRECSVLLAEALLSAVKRQSSLAEKSGLLLSGGLDSRLILSSAPRGSLSCWTTASYEDNPELKLARRVAGMYGADHHACIVAPEDTLKILDSSVVASGGLFPASTPVSAFLPQVDNDIAVLLTGHGLDFTLRGYYLPSRFLEVRGSKTRLPTLLPIPKNPTGHDVLDHLRQGPPRSTLDRIIAPAQADRWWNGMGDKFDRELSPWLRSDEPYNAWDAFILANLSKHYAFSGMMAVRDHSNLAIPAFDNQLFDVFLQMPPAWRCEGRVVQQAFRVISNEGAKLPNANTGFPSDLHPWLEVTALLGRGLMRRLGVVKRTAAPTPSHSQGSWQNLGALYRDEPGHRQRFKEIQNRLDALSFGMLDVDALSACIDEHLDGQAMHTKLMRQLLTHDSWVSSFGVTRRD